MMVLFHLYRRKLSSVPSLLLSIPTVVLLARFLPTHLLEEMIPLFLQQTVGSFLAFVGILSLLPIAHELCEKAGKQWYRSLTHIAGGLLIVYFTYLGKPLAILFLSAWFVTFLFAESLRALERRGKRDALISLSCELLSKPARNPIEEKFFVPSLFTLISSLLLVGLTPTNVAVFSILTLTLADPAAALTGISFGRHKWPHNPRKSFEGSLAFFLTCLLISALLRVNPAASVVIASSLAFFESMPLEISDNITIPLLASMLVTRIV